MGELSSAERELVAIGAALGSNCVPCIEFHIPEARKAGLTDQQIKEAVALADKVRQVPAGKVLAAARRLLPEAEPRTHDGRSACGVAAPAGGPKPCCDEGRRRVSEPLAGLVAGRIQDTPGENDATVT